MTDLRRRSIVFNNIDDNTWNRFKGKVGSDGRQIQELVLSWISAYIDPKEEPAPEKASGVRRRVHDDLETATTKEPGAEPELPTLEEAGIDFKDVQAHAGHLGLDIKGMAQEEAASLTLEAIFQDYVRNHEKLSAEEFDGYKSGNDDMLNWFNKNKDFGCTGEDEED